MASTNKTTNYELSQFIETDRPAWLTDYNGDMRKLDTALKAVSDVASGASGGISSLTDRMTAAEGAITTNANDIDALEARADALEAGAQSTAGTIANIQTEQTAQNLGIEAATELGYNLARPYDSASTYAVGAYVLFQNTLYKCVTAVSTGEAFDPTKWIAIKATDEIASGGTSYELIEFTANDQPFRLSTTAPPLLRYKDAYSDTVLTSANIANPSLSNFSGYYFKQGRLRQLNFSGSISFDPITFTGSKMYRFSAYPFINTNLIEYPKERTNFHIYLETTNSEDMVCSSNADFVINSYIGVSSSGIFGTGGGQSATRSVDRMFLRGIVTYIV